MTRELCLFCFDDVDVDTHTGSKVRQLYSSRIFPWKDKSMGSGGDESWSQSGPHPKGILELSNAIAIIIDVAAECNVG
jgi:hypothetical protein